MKFLAAALLLSMPALAQAILTAGNAASGSADIAPGALVAVSKSLAASGDLDPAHSRVRLQSTATFSMAILPTSTALAIYAVLPDTAPLGPAWLILSREGSADTSFSVNVVAASPGLFQKDGLAVAQNLKPNDRPTSNSLTNAAVPGQYITLWGTGLGNATAASVTVDIAGKIVTPTFAGHAAGSPGMDQIDFQIPVDVAAGCYDALSIRAQGAVSNQVAIAVSTSGGTCQHPLGLSPPELRTLDQGGSIMFGYVALARISADPKLLSLGFVTYEGATATLGRWDKLSLAELTPAETPDQQFYGCQIPAEPLDYFVPDGSTATGDAGPGLALTGPSSQRFDLDKIDARYLVPSAGGQYSGTWKSTSSPLFAPGAWLLGAPGGEIIGAFQQTFPLPRLHWLNPGALGVLKRSTGATIFWDSRGYQPNDVMTVRISNISYPDLTCRTHASAGRLELPGALLRQLSPSAKTVLSLSVAPHPANRFLFRLPLTSGGTAPAMLDYSFTDARLVDLQ